MRKDVDAVILAVPNNFHKPLAVAAMHAGKHVLCEKPVMMNSRDLLEVLAVSEQTGMLFTVHQNRRWDRDFCIVRECIQSGALGCPFYIESRVQGAKGIPGDWRCTQEAGGGMLLDWGVHLLDQLLLLADSPVREVYAHLLSVKFPEVDDNFKVMLRFENGLSALVEVDTYTFIPLPRWHVSGEKGTLQVDDFACGGRMVCAKNTDALGRGHRVYGRRPHAYHGAPPEGNSGDAFPAAGTDGRAGLLCQFPRRTARRERAGRHAPADARRHACDRRDFCFRKRTQGCEAGGMK